MTRPNRQQKSKQRKKKARERSKRQQKARDGEARSTRGRMGIAGRAPLRECRISEDWREGGLVQVLIARDAPRGIAVGVFLVDLECLGVKNAAWHDDLSGEEYDALVEHISQADELEPCSPELAVRVVQTGARYAADLGFKPHPDHALAREMFGDVDADACDEEVRCGRDGKPCFTPGPGDDFFAILQKLVSRLGQDGFEIDMGEDFDELEDDPSSELVERILGWATERLGPRFPERALDDLTFGDPEGLDDAIEDLFPSWTVFDWIPTAPKRLLRRGSKETAPLARTFAEEHRDELDEDDLHLLETVGDRPFSFHVVEALEPDGSVDLRDLFTGSEQEVFDPAVSRIAEEGDTLFARVVPIGDDATIVGCGSMPIPPGERSALIDLREELAGEGELLAEEELASHGVLFRRRYFALVRRMGAPRKTMLQNTDGDPLAYCELSFDLRCTPEEALPLLRPLTLDDEDDDESFAEVTRDEQGELVCAKLAWLREGNPVHPSWANTVLGHITVEPGRLVAEVNSHARAKKARREIERVLGDRAAYRTTEEKPLEELLEQSRRRAARDEDSGEDPEHGELVARMAEAHWASWFDAAIPLLAGETPRQAAKTAAGRERLDALLQDYESKATGAAGPFEPDVEWLRRELGI